MWRDCWIVLLSRPARALWIEIVMKEFKSRRTPPSRPARALWIEITAAVTEYDEKSVEAREGLVD